MRAQPFITQMRRGRLPAGSRRRHLADGPERPSGRNASPSGITPSHIMSPAPEPTRGLRTEVRLGARAHTTRTSNRPHAPPSPTRSIDPDNPDPALDTGPCTSKEQRPHQARLRTRKCPAVWAEAHSVSRRRRICGGSAHGIRGASRRQDRPTCSRRADGVVLLVTDHTELRRSHASDITPMKPDTILNGWRHDGSWPAYPSPSACEGDFGSGGISALDQSSHSTSSSLSGPAQTSIRACLACSGSRVSVVA